MKRIIIGNGVSIEEAAHIIGKEFLAACEGSYDSESISSSADKKIQAEVDREMSKIHIPPHLIDK